MMRRSETTGAAMLDRLFMGGLGALAGAATWALGESFDGTRPLLFLTVFVIGAFAVFFALSGPARILHAAAAAVGLVLPASALLVWASLRHASVESFLDRPQPALAFAAIVSLGTPFAAAALSRRGGWRDYAALFDLSWTIVVRYGLGWLFTGLFWLLLFLSDALLSIVGLKIIDSLISHDPVPYVLTGAVLGIALSVVHEYRAYISPFLILRLMRLLLPPVLAVVAIFLVALPIRGLSGLFGGLSVAGTLMAVTIAMLTLISAALDRDDGGAVASGFMRMTTRLSAVLTPSIALLALVAVALRVAQYGWTPDRMTAALATLILLVYGMGYAIGVLRRRGWMRRLRAVNLWMALVVIAVSALWLTPVLDAERLSVADQVARFRAGRVPAAGLPLYEMAHDWGLAGEAGLTRLAALEDHPDHDEVVALIERARKARYAMEYTQAADSADLPERRARLAGALQIRPEGATLPEGALEALDSRELDRWLDACDRSLPDGRSGCAIIVAPFYPNEPAPQGIVLLNMPGEDVQSNYVVLGDNGVQMRALFDLGANRWNEVKTGDLIRVLDGDFTVAPAGLQSLRIEGREFVPDQ